MNEAAALVERILEPATFFPVLARIGALVSFFPIFSAEVLPVRYRAALALGAAWLLRPVVPVTPLPDPFDALAWSGRIAAELLVGAAIGFAAQMTLAAFELAGHLIGFQMGLTLSGILDPQNGEQSSAFAALYRFLGIVLWLSIDAHHAFVLALRDSYLWLGTAASPGAGFAAAASRASAQIFTLALRMAAPALVVTLLVDVALLLAARALPQVNLLVLGYPVKIAIGLLAVAAGLAVLPRLAGGSLSIALSDARCLLDGLVPAR